MAKEKNKGGRPRKWTDEQIERFGQHILEWFNKDPSNVFYQGYFGYHDEFDGNVIYPDQIARFSRINDQFHRIIKRIEKLQQQRLVSRGMDEGKPVMSIFLLKALHGYKDTKHVESTSRVIHEKEKSELKALDISALKDLKRSHTQN